MQEICSSNPPVVIGNCDPKKSRARHHRKYLLILIKFTSKISFLTQFLIVLWNWLLGIFNIRLFGLLTHSLHESRHQRCSIKKAVLRKFAVVTGKHLCLSLFLIKLQKSLKTTILKNICEQLLLPVLFQPFW